jgi:alpha-amylase
VAGIAADEKPLVKKALTCLWKAQCNCAYWHGVFGGLYLSHLRDAIYENLIRAEDLADRLTGKKFPSLESMDIDADGFMEILVGTELLNTYFRPQRGGHMYELDYKPLAKNLLDTLTRREEGYHDRLKEAVIPGKETENGETASIHDLILAKEADLSSKLYYDFYERKSFIDHFLTHGTTLADFAGAGYRESGDFINEPYTLAAKKIGIDQIDLKLERRGKVWSNGLSGALKLSKNFRIANKKAHIIAEYTLENLSGNPLDLCFGVELNFGLQAGHADDRFYYTEDGQLENKFLDSTGIISGSRFIGMKDLWRGLDIQVSVSQKCEIWRFPIETISMSEGGFEKVYQSSVIFPNWPMHLVKKWQVRIELRINNLKKN